MSPDRRPPEGAQRPRTGLRRRVLLLGAVALLPLLASCVADPPLTAPLDGYQPPKTLERDTPERMVTLASIRFRVHVCGYLATASGFAIAPDTILTNRHVVEGATQIEASTWDGRDLHVVSAQAAPDVDLAVVKVSDHLDHTLRLADDDPLGKEQVLAFGYPKGNALTISPGHMLERLPGEDYGEPSVLLIDNTVVPGNSGGPLVDVDGQVVGVVFAYLLGSKTGLAIPVTVVHKVLDDNDLAPPPPCEPFSP